MGRDGADAGRIRGPPRPATHRNPQRLNTSDGPMGLFGGTFDPIHYGHLRTAFELWQSLKLTEVRFLPTGNPPHRERTLADAALRVAMVRAAVADQPAFVVHDRAERRAERQRIRLK